MPSQKRFQRREKVQEGKGREGREGEERGREWRGGKSKTSVSGIILVFLLLIYFLDSSLLACRNISNTIN